MKDLKMSLEISYSEDINSFIFSSLTVKDYYDQKDKCYSDNSDIYDDIVA